MITRKILAETIHTTGQNKEKISIIHFDENNANCTNQKLERWKKGLLGVNCLNLVFF